MSLCLIGLGSNQGDRRIAILNALEILGRQRGVAVLRRSWLVETVSVGGPPGQDRFLNAAAVLETTLDPDALLRVLLEVETALGRRRVEPWGPRMIDLDLLLYDEVVRSDPVLTLPHPRMAWRRFVLEPAAEIAAGMIHPTTGWTVARLLEHLNTAKNYLAIAGPIAAGKRELASQLALFFKTRRISDIADSNQMAAICADPAGNAWATELQFLDRRAQLLAADSPEWRESADLWVSDFWLDQGLAFARLRLPEDPWRAFSARWEEAARKVVRPKLIVLLDRPTDTLLERIAELGQAIAACWTPNALDRLRDALEECLRQPDVGPVLRLVDPSPEQMLREVRAAVEAMK